MAPPSAQLGTARAVVSLTDAALGHAPHRVIEHAHAHVDRGERVLVVGANGAGKSTLLATLAGLLPPVSGQVRVVGLDPLMQRRMVHRQTGHLGHSSGFYPELTGRENLTLHARLRGLGQDEADRQLEDAGLAPFADRPLAEYSHGMTRRLGLAKALLGAPRLLILDEPDAGLDREAHARLSARLGAGEATVIMATHSPHAHLAWASKAWVVGSRRLTEVRGRAGRIPEDALDNALANALQADPREATR